MVPLTFDMGAQNREMWLNGQIYGPRIKKAIIKQ